ncbi:MAG: helix-turn-helix transcriptional regulator [Bdellovibrionota bacterium]
MLLTLLQYTGPAVQYIADSRIVHSDSYAFVRDFTREISFHQAPNLKTRLGVLGLGLRIKRQQLELTQKQFAKLTGITRSHLCRIERGQCRPKMATLSAINTALKSQVISKENAGAAPDVENPGGLSR